MKKIACLLSALTLVFGSSLTANAEYKDDLSLDNDIIQEISELLEPKKISDVDKKTDENSVSFSLEDYEDLPTVVLPKGYDMDSICEVYSFNTETLAKTGNFDKSLDTETPFYIITFNNEKSIGESYIIRSETGELKVSDSIAYADFDSDYTFNFHIDEIEELLSNFDEIADLKLYQDAFNCINAVYFRSDETEYVIPYYTAKYFEEYEDMKQNNVYTLEEFVNWLNSNIVVNDTANNDETDKIGGLGIINSEKNVALNNSIEETETNSSNNFVFYLAILGGVTLVACSVVLKIRKKNTNV